MVEWRDIPGWEGMYRVSSEGAVLSLPRRHSKGGILSQNPNTSGYPTVRLSRENRATTLPVHSLVACAFLGSRPEDSHVDHINGNRADNRASNLRYLPISENNPQGGRPGESHYRTRLTESAVRVIRWAYNNGVAKPTLLARLHEISRGAVCNIVNRRNWKHVD